MKIAVAYIKGPRGFKGELAAVLYNADSQSIHQGAKVLMAKGENSLSATVEYVKLLKGRIAVKFIGIDDEDNAKRWKGAEVFVEKDDLPPLAENEFYHYELEGAEVSDENGNIVGTVERIDQIAANDMLNIKNGDKTIMVPFVKSIIKTIDLEAKKIVISKIDGLY